MEQRNKEGATYGNEKKIIALGKKMTDRIPYKLGLEKLTESDPEYYGLGVAS